MPDTIHVLSIDGGGTRGVFPATLLDCVEKETGKKIHELFQVIVGSATGGIIAAALAAGMETPSIIEIYQEKAKYILPKPFLRTFFNFLGLPYSKYDNRNLKALMEKNFGPKTLGEVTGPTYLFPTLKLNPDLPSNTIKGFKAVIFNSKDAKYANEKLVDVVLRTSAAATNLPIYQGYSEGGNYANDPALAGFFYCLSNPNELLAEGTSKVELQQIKILSLGCGSDEKSFVSDKMIGKGNWGRWKWLTQMMTALVIETKMVATQYYLNQIFTQDQYLRINVSYNASDAPDALKDKKLAIDVRDEKQLEALHKYALQTFEKQKKEILEFLKP